MECSPPVEHVNVPKLGGAICKEFQTSDDRLIQAQIRLMQTEGLIRIRSNEKYGLSSYALTSYGFVLCHPRFYSEVM